MDSPASTSAAAGPNPLGSVPPSSSAAAPARTKSKSYGTQIAKEGDVQKYRAKYKDLKLKVKEIEKDNDKIVLKILKAKRAIQRVRMERALIYERLVTNPLPPPTSTAPPPPELESFLVSSAPEPASTSASPLVSAPASDPASSAPQPQSITTAPISQPSALSAPAALAPAPSVGLVDAVANPAVAPSAPF